jgi:hypothetical protein
MKINVGSTDRVIRIVGGLLLLSLLFLLEGSARWLGLIGIIPLVTAAFKTCPAYSLLGMSTCPAKDGAAR